MMIHLIRCIFLVLATLIITLRISFPQLKDTLLADLISLGFQSHNSDILRVLQVVDNQQLLLWLFLFFTFYFIANKYFSAKLSFIYFACVLVLSSDWIYASKSHPLDYVSKFPPIVVIKDSKIEQTKDFIYPNNQPDLILIIQEALRADYFTKEYYPKTFLALQHTDYIRTKMIAAGGSTVISIPRIIHGEVHQSELPFECRTSLLKLACSNGYNGDYVSGYNYDWYSLSNLVDCCNKVRFTDPQNIALITSKDPTYQSLLKDPLGVRGSMIDDTITSKLSINNFRSADLESPHLSVLHLVNTHAPYTGMSHPPFHDSIYLPNAIHTLVMDKIEVPKYSQKMKHDYARAIMANDQLISDYLLQIKDISKLRKRPVYLILTGDHGEYLGENGRFFHATGVPLSNVIAEVGFLFARLDSSNVNSTFIDQAKKLSETRLMRHIDIAPSFRALAGEQFSYYKHDDGCPLFAVCNNGENIGTTLEQRQKFITYLK